MDMTCPRCHHTALAAMHWNTLRASHSLIAFWDALLTERLYLASPTFLVTFPFGFTQIVLIMMGCICLILAHSAYETSPLPFLAPQDVVHSCSVQVVIIWLYELWHRKVAWFPSNDCEQVYIPIWGKMSPLTACGRVSIYLNNSQCLVTVAIICQHP